MAPYDSSDDAALYAHFNHTELYQIARRAGHPVLPQYSRDALVQVIVGAGAPAVAHDFDEWRRALIRFLLDHRRTLETQVSCPARCLYTPAYEGTEPEVVAHTERDRAACFGCVDPQVVHCLTSQGEANFQLIQLRKKKV